MSELRSGDNNDRPIAPQRQIDEAFARAEKELTARDFRWFIDHLGRTDGNTGPSVRLVQFTVSGNRNQGVHIVLHMQASQFGHLVQAFEDNNSHVPYQIQVLSRYYGSKSIDVCITWGPGGG